MSSFGGSTCRAARSTWSGPTSGTAVSRPTAGVSRTMWPRRSNFRSITRSSPRSVTGGACRIPRRIPALRFGILGAFPYFFAPFFAHFFITPSPMRFSRLEVRSGLPLIFLTIALSGMAAATTQTPRDHDRVVTAVRVPVPPRLDGIPDEPEWQLASPAADFIQRDPHEGEPASEKTEIRVLYDRDAVYFGCVFHDSRPSEINSPFTRRHNH